MTSTTRFLVALAIAAGLLPAARAKPASPPSPGATDLSAIVSGKMFARAALAYQDGEFSDYRVFGIGAILVRHPAGMLLFDSGFGQQVDEHIKTMPMLMRWLSPHEKCVPVATQLAQNGIGLSNLKAVVLTHRAMLARLHMTLHVTRRQQAFVVHHVEGVAKPTLNGSPVGADPVALKNGDVIELAGTQMQFIHS